MKIPARRSQYAALAISAWKLHQGLAWSLWVIGKKTVEWPLYPPELTSHRDWGFAALSNYWSGQSLRQKLQIRPAQCSCTIHHSSESVWIEERSTCLNRHLQRGFSSHPNRHIQKTNGKPWEKLCGLECTLSKGCNLIDRTEHDFFVWIVTGRRWLG